MLLVKLAVGIRNIAMLNMLLYSCPVLNHVKIADFVKLSALLFLRVFHVKVRSMNLKKAKQQIMKSKLNFPPRKILRCCKMPSVIEPNPLDLAAMLRSVLTPAISGLAVSFHSTCLRVLYNTVAE